MTSGTTILPSEAGVLSRLAMLRAAQSGSNIASLFAATGLPSTLLDDIDIRVSAPGRIRLIEILSERENCHDQGFQLARDTELRELGSFFYLFSSADNLESAMNQFVRYCKFIGEDVDAYYAQTTGTLEFNDRDIAQNPDRHQSEFWMTCIIRMCRHCTGCDLTPTYVGFPHQSSGDHSEIERYYRCEVEFGASKNQLSFAPAYTGLSFVTADPYLNKIMTKYHSCCLKNLLSGGITVRAQVEDAITARLSSGTVTITVIAEDLGMSARTLSRRLAREGLTFGNILTNVRLTFAMHYLQSSDLSISQVAWSLGYAEVSSFTHAFQRWTGKSPAAARRRITLYRGESAVPQSDSQ